jgi:pimeloyl-ACP methyl ester carboxylesterase
MFVSENDLETNLSSEDSREINIPPSGAAYLFLKKLNEKLKEVRKKYPKFEVTLMGHSMGGIVINQALLRLPEFDVDNIVYMGSADSLQNYLNVTNILFHYRKEKNLNIYNLHLHPENENREITAYGVAPSGSLLAWIDHSYGAPEYILQRTSGRWSNMRKALNLIPVEQRDKHHFKVFGRGSEGASPQKHGHFDNPDFEFWEKTFWSGKQVKKSKDSSATR